MSARGTPVEPKPIDELIDKAMDERKPLEVMSKPRAVGSAQLRETQALRGYAHCCMSLATDDYSKEIPMRIALVLGSATLLALGGCSLLDRSSSSENVKTAYAGPASMTPQQVRQLLHNQGYTNVTSLHQNGDDWVGAATTSTGNHVDFDIDKNGVIHTK